MKGLISISRGLISYLWSLINLGTYVYIIILIRIDF
jgi:hypothetical protein